MTALLEGRAKMATLERPRKASPAGERGLNDHLRADAPSAFPVDELVALRGHTSQLSPQEVGTGSIVEHLEVREVGEPSVSVRLTMIRWRLTRASPSL